MPRQIEEGTLEFPVESIATCAGKIVNLSLVIGTDGHVKQVKVLYSKSLECAKAATRVAEKYLYTPSPLAKTLGLTRMLIFDYSENSTFDLNRWDLKEPVIPILEKQAQLLNTYFKALKVFMCGHTDSTGSAEYNLELSLKRAQEVANFLVSKGVDRTRLNIQGMGQDYPLASNKTEDGRGQNRCTEVILPQ